MRHRFVARPSLLWALGGLLFCQPLGAAAGDKSGPSVPPIQQKAFQLGYALQMPAARTEEFLEAVKGLKTITDDVQGVSEVGRLAKQSEALREIERRAYRQAAEMLRALGAPAGLQTWAGGAAYRLGLPLTLSKEANEYATSDPDTAAVLGTIDEAQAIKTDADGHMPGLLSWLKLTNGGDAVWATAVGGLAAGMHAAVAAGRGLSLSRTEPRRLRNAAPFSTPGPVLDALTGLTPSAGNLAGLIRLPASLIPIRELRGPQNTLLSSYDAHALSETIDKGP